MKRRLEDIGRDLAQRVMQEFPPESYDEEPTIVKLAWEMREALHRDALAVTLPVLTDAEASKVKDGQKIQAIAAYRARIDCGLVDAKAVVDRHEAALRAAGWTKPTRRRM